LTRTPGYAILEANQNGWVSCPVCGAKWLHKIEPDEECERLCLVCRRCKQKTYVKIREGQCFKSQSLRCAQ